MIATEEITTTMAQTDFVPKSYSANASPGLVVISSVKLKLEK
jgi:hypothetical protein